MKAVANQPVSVAVDGGDMTFEIYSVGVMTGSCGIGLDHGIAAIRYRKASDGTKYWPRFQIDGYSFQERQPLWHLAH